MNKSNLLLTLLLTVSHFYKSTNQNNNQISQLFRIFTIDSYLYFTAAANGIANSFENTRHFADICNGDGDSYDEVDMSVISEIVSCCFLDSRYCSATDPETTTFGRFYTGKGYQGIKAMSRMSAFPEFFVRTRSVK
ncbi:hypothetical protein AVEN_113801-1, partial [Araneus ventricosus]